VFGAYGFHSKVLITTEIMPFFYIYVKRFVMKL